MTGARTTDAIGSPGYSHPHLVEAGYGPAEQTANPDTLGPGKPGGAAGDQRHHATRVGCARRERPAGSHHTVGHLASRDGDIAPVVRSPADQDPNVEQPVLQNRVPEGDRRRHLQEGAKPWLCSYRVMSKLHSVLGVVSRSNDVISSFV